MKLLFLCHKMNLGGTEKALIALLNALPKDSLDIEVLLLERGGVLEADIPKHISISYLEAFPDIKPLIYLPPLKVIKDMLKGGKLFQAIQHLFTYMKVKVSGNWFHFFKAAARQIPFLGSYDIAVAFAGPSDFISYVVLNKVDAKKKVQWNHFDVEQVVNNSNFGKYFYPRFDQFFSVSENAKRSFDQMFPMVKERSYVFPNIISSEVIQKEVDTSESYKDDYAGVRIVTLGRLSKEKGQQMIAPVVKRLKDEGYDFKWYLIGDGNLRKRIEEQIRQLNLEEDLILLGSQLKPYAFLKNADIYVQSSLHEGHCITLKEAKVFDLPVVTTNFLSANNLIQDQKDGLIVEISEEGLYQGVRKLLDNERLRKELSISLIKDSGEEEAMKRLLTL